MKGRVERFLDRPASEQRRMAHAALLVAAFRLGLWFVPYRILRQLAQVVQTRPPVRGDTSFQDRIAQNVVTVSGYFPGATCLTQALAAHVLLRREGFDPQLQLGVARDADGKFIAHAWIECDGRVIIGGSEAEQPYITLQAIDRPLRGSSRVIASGP